MMLRVKRALKETIKEQRKEKRRKGGWYEGCAEARRELRRWRRNSGREMEYRARKREYRELCERKKRRKMLDGKGKRSM